MEAFLREERLLEERERKEKEQLLAATKEKEKVATEPMDTEGQDEPMQQS